MIPAHAPRSKQPVFHASRQAALKQLGAIKPDRYDKTHHYLNGEVTFLSPWITHGFLSVRECVKAIHDQYGVGFDSPLVFEFAWREFFKHVHQELGDAIFRDIQTAVWQGQYAEEMPHDILSGQTGVEPIDSGIRQLYETGYLHNHLRLWIASYVVHMRKVHWKTGADWMYAHLLDGDLASNHLSWQWVAGTFSTKPYVFNADNVKKYAGWLCCPNTVIDKSYEALEKIARCGQDMGPEPSSDQAAIQMPALLVSPLGLKEANVLNLSDSKNLGLARKWIAKQQALHLVHPWDLGQNQDGKTQLGVVDLRFHEAHPWNQKRWEFVLQGMKSTCEQVWVLDSDNMPHAKTMLGSLQEQGFSVTISECLNPGYRGLSALLGVKNVLVKPLFPQPKYFQSSFSKFYRAATKKAGQLATLF